MKILLFSFVTAIFLKEVLSLHLYAAAMSNYFVVNSPELNAMYKCKDRCLAMSELINHPLKYHRIVYAKPNSADRYLEGHCYFTVDSQEWLLLSSPDNRYNRSQITELIKECQDKRPQIDQQTLVKMGFTNIHSQYQFYSNGTFLNLQKEINMGQLITDFKNKMGVGASK